MEPTWPAWAAPVQNGWYTVSDTQRLCLPSRVSKDNPVLLEDPVLNAIAARHRRTPAQVALRYQLQRGVVPLAKSFNEKRIQENFQVHGGVGGAVGTDGGTSFPSGLGSVRHPRYTWAKLTSLRTLCTWMPI